MFPNIGTPLPSPKGADWPCSECNGHILNTYADYAGNKDLPLSKTFGPAREKLIFKCGTNFVKQSASVNHGNSMKQKIWNIIAANIFLLLL